ncbi:hypothetical protein Q3G72_013163 [Acer saccharum]|nr:hypothetical protein Q3G72_013163 [Acer saccharum]
MTDVKKREVNLRKVFGLENHRVSDYKREDYGSEENNIETEKKQWAAYIEDLLNLESELEKIRAKHEHQPKVIEEEREPKKDGNREVHASGRKAT